MTSSLLGSHIHEWPICKDFVTYPHPHHCPTLLYIFCCLSSSLSNFAIFFFPPCMLHKLMLGLEERIYLGSCPLPCFDAYMLLTFKCPSWWLWDHFSGYRLAELGHFFQILMIFIRQIDCGYHPERHWEAIAVKKWLQLPTNSSSFVGTREKRAREETCYFHM